MEIYTIPQVAKILGVGKGYVYELIHTGQLNAFRLSERRYRITEKALVDFLRNKEKEAMTGN